MIWIKLVNKGVANRYSYEDYDVIEINIELLKNEQLFKAIMKHEMLHTPGSYKLKDLMLDLHDGIKKPGYLRFLCKTKTAWWQFSPIWYEKERGVIYDIGNLANLLIVFSLLWFMLKIIGKILI